MGLRERLRHLEQRGPCTTCFERMQAMRHSASRPDEIRRVLLDAGSVAAPGHYYIPRGVCAECGCKKTIPLWWTDALVTVADALRAEQGEGVTPNG
jgi:hypothetical protein